MSQTFAFVGRSNANGAGTVEFQIPFGQWWYIQNIWCQDTAHTAWQLRVDGYALAQGQGVGAFSGVGLRDPGGKINVDFASGTVSGGITVVVYAEVFSDEPEGRAPQDVTWDASSLGGGIAPPNPTVAFDGATTATGTDVTLIAAPASGLQIYLYLITVQAIVTPSTGIIRFYAGPSANNVRIFGCSPGLTAPNVVVADLGGIPVAPDANGNPQAFISNNSVGTDNYRINLTYTIDAVQQANPFLGGGGSN
jgi:hypothetical protein